MYQVKLSSLCTVSTISIGLLTPEIAQQWLHLRREIENSTDNWCTLALKALRNIHRNEILTLADSLDMLPMIIKKVETTVFIQFIILAKADQVMLM